VYWGPRSPVAGLGPRRRHRLCCSTPAAARCRSSTFPSEAEARCEPAAPAGTPTRVVVFVVLGKAEEVADGADGVGSVISAAIRALIRSSRVGACTARSQPSCAWADSARSSPIAGWTSVGHTVAWSSRMRALVGRGAGLGRGAQARNRLAAVDRPLQPFEGHVVGLDDGQVGLCRLVSGQFGRPCRGDRRTRGGRRRGCRYRGRGDCAQTPPVAARASRPEHQGRS